MLAIILKERNSAKGIYGIFPANQVNDDDIEFREVPVKGSYQNGRKQTWEF
jgi:cobalamin-dependent methionine synthase I